MKGATLASILDRPPPEAGQLKLGDRDQAELPAGHPRDDPIPTPVYPHKVTQLQIADNFGGISGLGMLMWPRCRGWARFVAFSRFA